jgi:hypothetical protein
LRSVQPAVTMNEAKIAAFAFSFTPFSVSKNIDQMSLQMK